MTVIGGNLDYLLISYSIASSNTASPSSVPNMNDMDVAPAGTLEETTIGCQSVVEQQGQRAAPFSGEDGK